MVSCLVALALVAAGCSDGSDDNEESTQGGVLTIGISSDTSTLDPAGCIPQNICWPAYDGLIFQNPEGEFEPDLATAWEFVDDSHTTLRLTLRDDAKFTDGTELTGEVAAASINRFSSVPSPVTNFIFPIEKAEAAGKYELDVHYSMPVTLTYALSQLTNQSNVGSIIGAAGQADPTSLETTSYGVGPYKLDAARTTKGSEYVYVPNDQYFNQDAIKYDEIVIKPMLNESSRLSALEAGQIDWAHSLTQRSADAAAGSGAQVVTNKLGAVAALVLMNRSSGPLADQRVRQAISHAIPRDDIVNAVYGESATPTSSAVSEGVEGYNPDNTDMYDYDVDKAKQLMAEAGYADGFTLSVIDVAFFDPGFALGQALESSLAEIGITVKLTTTDALPGATNEMIMSGEYDAQITAASALGTFSLVKVQYGPNGPYNPLGAPGDDELTAMVDEAAKASEDQQQSLMQAATTRFDELAWEIPVASVPTIQVVGSQVKNVPETFQNRELDPFSPETDGNWYTEK